MLTALAVVAAALFALLLACGFGLGFRLLLLYGRMLDRIDSLDALLNGFVPSAGQASLATQEPGAASDPPRPAGAPAAGAPNEPARAAPRMPLQPGTAAPPFELPEVRGGQIALAQLLGRALLVIFFDPACGFGTRLVPDLPNGSPDGLDGRPLPVVIGEGEFEQVRRLFVDNGVHGPVFHDTGGAVAAAWGVDSAPTGYLLDAEGRVASHLLVGVDAILAELRPNRGGRAQEALRTGAAAPAFRLPRLGGGELSLETFRGQRLLLIFVDPHCEPCYALAPELEALQRASAEVEVVLIGRGGAEAMQGMVADLGLTMPVGLQQGWELSREFRTLGSPVGFVLDEDGTIAQPALTGLAALRAALPALR